MKIPIPLKWFHLVLHLLDLDPSDGDIKLGVGLLFHSGREVGTVVKIYWR